MANSTSRRAEDAMAVMSVKDAAEAVATMSGLPKRQVYQLALKMKG